MVSRATFTSSEFFFLLVMIFLRAMMIAMVMESLAMAFFLMVSVIRLIYLTRSSMSFI